MACIYKITNLVNGKIYVGQTIDLTKRWRVHLSDARNPSRVKGRYLYKSMRKYGEENFTIEVIEECAKEKLSEREIFWISKLRPEYNLTLGGDGANTIGCKSQEEKQAFRKKVSEARKKQYNDPEFRERMKRVAQDPERRRKLSEGLKGCNSPNWKGKVAFIDTSGNIVNVFDTVSGCSKSLGFGETTIRRCIDTNSPLKHKGPYKGFRFSYTQKDPLN